MFKKLEFYNKVYYYMPKRGVENMQELEIIKKENAISIIRKDKTVVDYFIFDEEEIHINILPSNTVQDWHRHQKIEEIIYVMKGEITVEWFENDNVKSANLVEDQMVRVKQSIHRILNNTKNAAKLIVFRLVLTGENLREVIKNDKQIVDLKEKLNKIK